ncbi:tripartite tricarboxylate transporter permease [Salinarimonas rosea]|uniref:tripartite tricarboxylate transporter permease n=1 Tax=Salinarimonas rosea TaxID=552063 RepID=UPI000412FCEE|nr:tripartite tricarboxylate transporter permease [Salinarimonas rosea]
MDSILQGFSLAFGPEQLLFCFLGVLLGTLVGTLPGIGAAACISIVLPMTFGLDGLTALIMLSGIFYGSQYGSSTAAILLNIPGTSTAAVTCLDGYPMAQQGKAGTALFVTTIASFVGGSIAIVLLMGVSPVLANVALRFGSAEYFAVMVLGLVAALSMGAGSATKGAAMTFLGLLLGTFGMDMTTGAMRYTFGFPEMTEGIGILVLTMGLFGVSELLSNISRRDPAVPPAKSYRLRGMLPDRSERRQMYGPCLRGTAIGSLIGALPGAGPTVAAFLAYSLEQKVSRTPERFGKGAIEGITAPEAANNAAVQSAFIPTLSLGIPGDAVMAILLAAMTLHGIVPGSQFMATQPDFFWGLIASFWIGNLMLLALNLPFIGLWARITRIPHHYLSSLIAIFILLGVYSARNSLFDVFLAVLIGVVGWGLSRQRYPLAPLILGFVLGPLLEEHFRRVMLISRGDLTALWSSEISLGLLSVAAGLAVLTAWRQLRGGRAGAAAVE